MYEGMVQMLISQVASSCRVGIPRLSLQSDGQRQLQWRDVGYQRSAL